MADFEQEGQKAAGEKSDLERRPEGGVHPYQTGDTFYHCKGAQLGRIQLTL